jgi:phenylalanyl-tRNA synthetase beta chain
MTVSYAWLQELLPHVLPFPSPAETAAHLTASGLEIETTEAVERIPGGLRGVVVGEVLTVEQHPNADRLRLTTVAVGADAPLHIVCGAPNVAVGQKVAVATVGCTLYPTGSTEPLNIQKGKIRGEVSEGMLCAEDELGLGTSHDGIWVLRPNATAGQPLADYLGWKTDYALEMGLTPNRTDALGHFGVARDLAAVLTHRGTPARAELPSVTLLSATPGVAPVAVRVEDEAACPRYFGLLIEGVRVQPSPENLQARLQAVGLKPINNLVDATNWVLHELGHPLHAFDADRIGGNQLMIRRAQPGEKLVTLDEKERVLHPDDLVIADAHNPLCLAGVFGGLTSGVQSTTERIVVESAWFAPSAVRKTAKRHALNTDASFRYERGVDPTLGLIALQRFVDLIRQTCPDVRLAPVAEAVAADTSVLAPRSVVFSPEKARKLMGHAVPNEVQASIFSSLDIRVLSPVEADEWTVEVPAYRWDVTRQADLTEELLRIYGLNEIPFPDGMRVHLAPTPRLGADRLRQSASAYLVAHGALEAYNNSLTRAAYAHQHPAFPEGSAVEVLNPLSQDLGILRPTLLFGLVESIAYNVKRQQPNLLLFELGRVYRKLDPTSATPWAASAPALPLPKVLKGKEENVQSLAEGERLGLALRGEWAAPHWQWGARPGGFSALKGAVLGLLAQLGLEDRYSEEPLPEAGAPGLVDEGIALFLDRAPLGVLGLAATALLRATDAEGPVWVAELDWGMLAKKAAGVQKKYVEPPKFPASERDLALLVPNDVPYRTLVAACRSTKEKTLTNVQLFDVYTGKNLPEGHTSYGLRLTFQDHNATLKDGAVDHAVQRMVEKLEAAGAQLRG